MTRIVPSTPDNVAQAAALLLRGGLVGFPTETVYGLGAAAGDDRAVARIFEAKRRPQFNPLIVHIVDAQAAERLAVWNPLAEKLAQHFWPGPLSLVLPRRQNCPVSLLCSAGLDTIALRSPAHPVARALIRAAATPIAAPSANRSGAISPTSAAHVDESLGEAVDLILDGGECAVGIESTVVDLTIPEPRLLRAGGVTREAIETLLEDRLEIPSVLPGQARLSPGMLDSHYAPTHLLRLDADSVADDEALLAFGAAPLRGARHTLNLSPTGDLREAAANLFAMMRELDRTDAARIAAMPIPDHGLGEAINDRLKRAAAPR